VSVEALALASVSTVRPTTAAAVWLRRFQPHEPAAAAPVHRLSPAGEVTAGVVTHLPGVCYLAGLGAIAGTGAAAAGMVVQVLIYDLVWFAPALVALGICLFG
jgi:hypothetical protein